MESAVRAYRQALPLLLGVDRPAAARSLKALADYEPARFLLLSPTTTTNPSFLLLSYKFQILSTLVAESIWQAFNKLSVSVL